MVRSPGVAADGRSIPPTRSAPMPGRSRCVTSVSNPGHLLPPNRGRRGRAPDNEPGLEPPMLRSGCVSPPDDRQEQLDGLLPLPPDRLVDCGERGIRVDRKVDVVEADD